MRFIFLRLLTAFGIICILWNYALPFKQYPSSHAQLVAMQQSPQPPQPMGKEPSLLPDLTHLLQKTGASHNAPLLLFLLAFLVGILISFTPCVYPLIPITVGILHKHASASLLSNFAAACSYVAGISLVYATLGYMVARTSLIFGQWLSNPWVIGFMILFFLYLAFSLFGFYELYIPNFLKQGGGIAAERQSYFHIFIFGIISGFVASPCLTPGFAALLAIVAEEKNPIVGFLTMFFFSLGANMLLIVIGTFSNALTVLPQAGPWLKEIERGMGFMILALCVYFLQPLLSMNIIWLLYGGVIVAALCYYGLRLKMALNKQ